MATTRGAAVQSIQILHPDIQPHLSLPAIWGVLEFAQNNSLVVHLADQLGRVQSPIATLGHSWASSISLRPHLRPSMGAAMRASAVGREAPAHTLTTLVCCATGTRDILAAPTIPGVAPKQSANAGSSNTTATQLPVPFDAQQTGPVQLLRNAPQTPTPRPLFPAGTPLPYSCSSFKLQSMHLVRPRWLRGG